MIQSVLVISLAVRGCLVCQGQGCGELSWQMLRTGQSSQVTQCIRWELELVTSDVCLHHHDVNLHACKMEMSASD